MAKFCIKSYVVITLNIAQLSMSFNWLYVESEMHHIAILHDVFFAF